MNASSPRTPSDIPFHIHPNDVVDYDIYGDSRFRATGDLHESLFKLAEEGRGIHWTPHNGGHWFINDHELLFQAARDPELFSNNTQLAGDGTMVMIPPMEGGGEPHFGPQSMNPPRHGVYRLPLMKAFAPNEIKRLEASVRSLAADLIASLAPLGRDEFLKAVAEPLPVTVFMKMMGMPLSRLAEFRSWMSNMMSLDDSKRTSAFANVNRAMRELIEARQVKREDDLISRLLESDIEGHPPTMEDMQAYCLLLFTAGLDTLVNAFTFGMYHLACHPELQERVRNDRGLIPALIEEVLRRYAVVMLPRVVGRDAEFGGVQLKKGDRVLLMLPAGNLDPGAFPDPMKFDIDRENKAHMTFNSGPHRCVGSHLARLEMRVFYEEWFARMPNVHTDPDEPPTYRPGLNLTICKLPLIWDAANRQAGQTRRARAQAFNPGLSPTQGKGPSF
jgi:cytochrome P450